MNVVWDLYSNPHPSHFSFAGNGAPQLGQAMACSEIWCWHSLQGFIIGSGITTFHLTNRSHLASGKSNTQSLWSVVHFVTGLIQENEAHLGSGIFVASNRGSAALKPGPSRRGLLGNPRRTDISAV
jgi:hypothetical protein